MEKLKLTQKQRKEQFEHDRKVRRSKRIGLTLTGVFLGLAFWLFARILISFIFFEKFQWVSAITIGSIVLLLFSLFIAYIGYASIFYTNSRQVYWAIFLWSLPYLGVNLAYGAIGVSKVPDGHVALLASLVIGSFLFQTIALFYWIRNIRAVMRNQITPLLAHAMHSGIRFAISMMLLFTSFMLYFELVQVQDSASIISRLEQSQRAVVHQAIGLFVGGYGREMSMRDFVKEAVDLSLVQNAIPEGISVFQLKDNQVADQIVRELSNELNISVRPQDTVDDAMVQLSETYFTSVVEKYSDLFTFAIALLIFLFLRAFRGVYILLVRMFIGILTRISIATHFVRVMRTERWVDKFEL